jgi:hypothetical protein
MSLTWNSREIAPRRAFGWRPMLRAMRDAESRFFDLGIVLAVAVVPTLLAAWLDPRTLGGASVWAKPLKFELSLMTYVLTLALTATLLPARVREARWYRLFSWGVVAAVVLEMVWLIGAAMLGTTAHFNPDPVAQMIYRSMGALAILLTSATAVHAWQIARAPQSALSPVVKRGIVLGLGLVLPLTLLTAGTMSTLQGSYVGEATEPVRLALLGWARDGGDLRVAHFFATHAMHFIPAVAIGAAALAPAGGRRVVDGFTLLYTALVGLTFIQALMGRPFLPWL